MDEVEWKRRFSEEFAKRLRAAGYDNEDDLPGVVRQHADASWPERDEGYTPEDAAEAEIDALADSV